MSHKCALTGEHRTGVRFGARRDLRDAPVIVVTYNSSRFIGECLRSLKQSGCPSVIVVDNHSADGTPDIVRTVSPDSTLICNRRNLGFPAAVAMGVEATRDTPYFALLNPDTVVTEGWLSHLLEAADEDVGCAQGLLMHFDGTVDSAGGYVDKWGYPVELYKGRQVASLASPRGEPYDVGYAKGAAALFRREAYQAVGGFDQRFFFYYDETDLCYRLRRAGYRVVCAPKSVVYHADFSSELPNKRLFAAYYMERNHLLFLWKNSPRRVLPAFVRSVAGMVLGKDSALLHTRRRAYEDFVKLVLNRRVAEPFSVTLLNGGHNA